MIYLKIYITLVFVTLVVAGSSWSFMNSDKKRSDMWYKISKISWISLATMIIVGALIAIYKFYETILCVNFPECYN